MQTTALNPDLPDRCELQHRLFTILGDVRFRRSSTDGIPMMALRLGEREAQLPLESLRREFGIGSESPDGRMLELIGSSLDYVASLQPGDRLPSEVRTGEASWKPSANHVRLAATRIRLDLIVALAPRSRWAGVDRDELSLLRLADDPAMHDDLCDTASRAAAQLGLPDAQAVIRLLDELAHELAYIEALRERLLGRAASLCRRVGRLLRDRGRPPCLVRHAVASASADAGRRHADP